MKPETILLYQNVLRENSELTRRLIKLSRLARTVEHEPVKLAELFAMAVEVEAFLQLEVDP